MTWEDLGWIDAFLCVRIWLLAEVVKLQHDRSWIGMRGM